MKCPRCGKNTTNLLVSIFNRDKVCMSCLDRESESPRYEEADKACRDAEKRGDHDFEGIGWTP